VAKGHVLFCIYQTRIYDFLAVKVSLGHVTQDEDKQNKKTQHR
jgi:hypothetical protein